jgi:inosose dehydratase
LKDIDPAVLKMVRAKRTGFHDAVIRGVFAALGQGGINFQELLQELQGIGYDGWAVVEQDVLEGGTGADMALTNATAARNYLKQLGI